jgi:hypothetical protein
MALLIETAVSVYPSERYSLRAGSSSEDVEGNVGQPSPPRFGLRELRRGTCKATAPVLLGYVNVGDPQDTAEVSVSLRQPQLAHGRPVSLDHKHELLEEGLPPRKRRSVSRAAFARAAPASAPAFLTMSSAYLSRAAGSHDKNSAYVMGRRVTFTAGLYASPHTGRSAWFQHP